MDSFETAMEVTRIGVTRPAALLVPFPAFLTAALTLAARPMAGVIKAIGRGLGQSADLIARLRAVLAAALTLTPRASAAVIQAIGRGITRFIAWIMRRRPLPAIPLKTSVRAVGVVLVLAFVLYTLQWTPGPRQHVRSTAAPGPRLEPTHVVSLLSRPPVAPSVEPDRAAPAAPRIDGPRQSPSKPSAFPSPRLPVRETPALPAPVPQRVAPVTDVVGRLAAKDRTAVERDLTALLAGVDGTELGRRSDPEEASPPCSSPPCS
jgi:hypothetical protein